MVVWVCLTREVLGKYDVNGVDAAETSPSGVQEGQLQLLRAECKRIGLFVRDA